VNGGTGRGRSLGTNVGPLAQRRARDKRDIKAMPRNTNQIRDEHRVRRARQRDLRIAD